METPSIKKNYIMNTLYQILVLIVPLITTPYISRVLGADGIGIYSYTYSIISYFILIATMGTSTYGQRTIAYNHNNKKERSIKFFEIFIFRLLNVIVCSIIYFVYTMLYVKSNKFIYCLQILHLISVAFDVTWFFQGIEDFKKVILRNIFIKILTVLLIFIFVKNNTDVWKYTVILSATTLLGSMSILTYIPKYVQKVRFGDINIFRNFKDIFLLFIPTIAVQVYTVVDKTMIGSFSDSSVENGYYEQVDKIIRMTLALITSLGTVMIPRIAKVFAQNDLEQMKKYLKKSYQFIWLLGIPLMFGIIGITKIFVPIFYGSGYEKLNILLPIYSCIIIAVSLSNVTGCQFLIPTKRQNVYTIAVSVSAIFNFFLNLILIPRLLSIGAAIASIVAETIGAVIMLIFVNNEKLISLKEIFRDSIKYWIAGIIMLLFLLILSNNLAVSVISLAISIILGGILYFCILFILKDDFFISNIKSILLYIKLKIGK